MNHLTLQLGAVLIGAVIATTVLAETDVDQADSLRFNEFFKDKKDSVKIWKDSEGRLDTGKRQETVKAYEQAPEATGTATADPVPASSTATPAASTASAPAAGAAEEVSGRRYEIRERYTLSRSAKTPYSAFYVIEALHQQMARLCPAGWRKLSERSEPVEQDFYLYYELECL